MQILIIGGLGYFGPLVAKTLKEYSSSLKIDCADVLWYRKSYINFNNEYYDNIFNVDKRKLSEEFSKKYQIIIDLAAVSNDPMGSLFEKQTIDINCTSSIKICDSFIKSKNCKYIFASSCSIYGTKSDYPKKESDIKNPLTAYARSKNLFEEYYQTKIINNASIYALRFATACGWSDHFRADLVLNDFVTSGIIEKKIIILSDGTPIRPLIHIKDIAKSIVWAVFDKNFKGFNSFNIGSNKWSLSILDLAKNVSKIMNIKYELQNKNTDDKRSYEINFEKFTKAAKDYTPSENLETTVKDLYDNISRYKNLFNDFRSGNFIRLNVLKNMINKKLLNKDLFYTHAK